MPSGAPGSSMLMMVIGWSGNPSSSGCSVSPSTVMLQADAPSVVAAGEPVPPAPVAAGEPVPPAPVAAGEGVAPAPVHAPTTTDAPAKSTRTLRLNDISPPPRIHRRAGRSDVRPSPPSALPAEVPAIVRDS